MKMGSQLRTLGHNKSVNRPHRCPKVLGKPIHVDKSSSRYRASVGTYSKHWMSFEFPRFLDIIEYSTCAIINHQKSHRHPALREQVILRSFTTIGQYLIAKITRISELSKILRKKFHYHGIVTLSVPTDCQSAGLGLRV